MHAQSSIQSTVHYEKHLSMKRPVPAEAGVKLLSKAHRAGSDSPLRVNSKIHDVLNV